MKTTVHISSHINPFFYCLKKKCLSVDWPFNILSIQAKIHIQLLSFFPDPTSIEPELDFGVIDGLCDVVDVLVGLVVVLLHRGRQRLKRPEIHNKFGLKTFFATYLTGFSTSLQGQKGRNRGWKRDDIYLIGQ